ncbi:MAG: transcription antitermination factor NusB [bacterium]|nr:transcription antitermination factor NusB [bacterium]
MSRRKLRRKIFQWLFELEFRPDAIEEIKKKLDAEFLVGEDREFAIDIIEGVWSKKDEIDEIIKSHLKGWNFDRISPVEKSILRMGIYELCFYNNTPPRVAINEAVELSKLFGKDSSPEFINGLLGAVFRGNGV